MAPKKPRGFLTSQNPPNPGQETTRSQICNTTRPGWGGVFMVMDCFFSVVIDIINVLRAAVKTENHSAVGPDRHGPEALERAPKRIQPEPRQIHVGDGWGSVKRCQDISRLTSMVRIYSARIGPLKKPFQPLVAN